MSLNIFRFMFMGSVLFIYSDMWMLYFARSVVKRVHVVLSALKKYKQE